MNPADWPVFDKWKDAPEFAFGRKGDQGLVPIEDKEAYWRIFEALRTAAQGAVHAQSDSEHLFLRPMNYSRKRGSRGHRPRDLWVSICHRGAEKLGFFPQVYVIASDRGLEVGFAASIPEEDYFDPPAKLRNRTIVPFINSKLSWGDKQVVTEIDKRLAEESSWHFNYATRRVPGKEGFDQFVSLSKMLEFLKSGFETEGAGAACRLWLSEALAPVDLEQELTFVLSTFLPLLQRAAPTAWDLEVRQAQDTVEGIAKDLEFEPHDEEDGRRRTLATIAQRQGQTKFRVALLEAYEGRCAVSGYGLADVLEAAHIIPYRGPKTNHVTNGLLLRADIHTLFDLKLLSVDAANLSILVSPRLQGTPYWVFGGKSLRLPNSKKARPNPIALAQHNAELKP